MQVYLHVIGTVQVHNFQADFPGGGRKYCERNPYSAFDFCLTLFQDGDDDISDDNDSDDEMEDSMVSCENYSLSALPA